MPYSKITSSDIANWDSIDKIAESLEKRGLEREKNLSEHDDEIVLRINDDEFVAVVKAEEGKKASDYRTRMDSARHTQVVSTTDFENFTFTSRRRSWDKHGRIQYQKFSFSKDQFTGRGEKRSVLEKLNNIEYGDSRTIDQIYETQKVVKKFYDEFEEIKAEMVRNVENIPEDRGDAKQNYAQTIFDRLIFLYFIQEKKLLDYKKDYLRRHHERITEEGEDVYEEFYEPLFFKLLSEGAKDTEFGELPYLNGGLFSKTRIEEEFPEARLGSGVEETNELFEEILDFLDSWNWHADERLDIVDPNRVSPELLGHIFEKTVNQKEMGAYYTPEEITHFMARNSIHPYIIDRLNEKFDTNYEEIDEVFNLDEYEEDEETYEHDETRIGELDGINREEVEHLYFEVLEDLKVLDPAVGSGAFLLAAQEVLLDVYLSCIEYFQKLDEEQKWEMTPQITEFVQELEEGTQSESMHAKREIILQNLYGVDIDRGATEICKLRLWLSIVADLEEGKDPTEVETLPNIDFNIRQGNSLVGFTQPLDKALDGGSSGQNTQSSLHHFNEDSIKEKYEDIIDAIEKHKRADSSKEAEKYRKDAEELLSKYRSEPNQKIKKQFENAGAEVDKDTIEDFSPFHWVLEFAEVYSEGGFDVIVGNPPWEQLKPLRDEYFEQFDATFRGLKPDEKKERKKELLEDPEIEAGWEEYQREIDIQSTYFKKSGVYQFQQPVVDGRKHGTERELAALFLERVFSLADEEGYVSQILPGKIWNGSSAKDLRMHLLNGTNIRSLVTFENKGIFSDIHPQYRFGVVVFENQDETEELEGIFGQTETDILERLDDASVQIPKEVLAKFSPEARTFPTIKSEEDVKALKPILDYPPIGDDIENKWVVQSYRELDRTNDSDRFVEKEKGDYPIYSGGNIFQFCYKDVDGISLEDTEFWSVDEEKDPEVSAKRRIREKNTLELKKQLYQAFDGSGSQKKFVNELLEKKRGRSLELDDVLLDCRTFRIAYRYVARQTDERSMIASVLPKGVVTRNQAPTVRPFEINPSKDDLDSEDLHSCYEEIFSTEELFYAVGIMNSLPFDFVMRMKADASIPAYRLEETQAPRLTEGDKWFEFIWERAAKLNAYDEEFKEVREELDIEAVKEGEKRKELQAEIDAAAFKAYGVEDNEARHILDTFHKVNNPRMMDDEYFDMVWDKYQDLKEKKEVVAE